MGGMTRGAKIAATAAALLCGLLAALLPAAPASAHAALVRTSPAQGGVVVTAPNEVVLTFSEPVSVVTGKVRVIAPDGSRADGDAPTVRGGVVAIPVRSDAGRGTYLVSYRVISADAHPVSGGFTYSVGAPSATPPALPAEDGSNPVVGTLIPVVKYLGYAGLVLAVGPTLVLAALWPRRLSRRRPSRLAAVGLGLVALGAIGELLLQGPYETGAGLSGMFSGLRDVLDSWFGTMHLVRLAVIASAAFLLRPVLAGRAGVADRVILAILAVVGLSTWPLSGHPAASPVPAVTVVADLAHLASMAVWLGGLTMLLGFLLRQAEERELAAILPIWSRWAAVAIGVLFVAGTLQALVEIGTVTALFRTAYGQLVLVKTGLLGTVLAVAWFSRRLVQGRAAAGAPGRLRRYVGVELAGTAVVVALAAVLVQTTPARTAGANPGGTDSRLYSTTLSSELYSLQVELDPAETGNDSLHLYAYTLDGKPQPVVEWKATAALPSAAVEPIQIPLLTITENHTIGTVTLPTPGNWEFRFTLRLTDVDQATVDTTVHIR